MEYLEMIAVLCFVWFICTIGIAAILRDSGVIMEMIPGSKTKRRVATCISLALSPATFVALLMFIVVMGAYVALRQPKQTLDDILRNSREALHSLKSSLRMIFS